MFRDDDLLTGFVDLSEQAEAMCSGVRCRY